MKTTAIVLLCLLCSGCDSIVLKSAMESRPVQPNVQNDQKPPDTDPALLLITGERNEKYYRVIDYSARDKMSPVISYPKSPAGYTFEQTVSPVPNNVIAAYTYNHLVIDPVSYEDLYAGPPYFMHISGEASFDSNAYFSGAWHFLYVIDGVTQIVLDADSIFDSLHEKYSIAKPFEANSLSLPKTAAYSSDYREELRRVISVSVPDSFLRSLPGEKPVIPDNITDYTPAHLPFQLRGCGIPDSLSAESREPCILESRDFYEYKTIFLKFRRYTKVELNYNWWPIVKNYQWDPYNLELTITLNGYETPYSGPVLSYTVFDGNNNFAYQKTLVIE